MVDNHFGAVVYRSAKFRRPSEGEVLAVRQGFVDGKKVGLNKQMKGDDYVVLE